jgi:hypothetical protein
VKHPKALLAGYTGILQCNGHTAYQTLAAANAAIALAFCGSHIHREFIKLAKGKTAPIATGVLQRIAALYAIEAEVRGRLPEIRHAARQTGSWPLVEDRFPWFAAPLAAYRVAIPPRRRSATR